MSHHHHFFIAPRVQCGQRTSVTSVTYDSHDFKIKIDIDSVLTLVLVLVLCTTELWLHCTARLCLCTDGHATMTHWADG